MHHVALLGIADQFGLDALGILFTYAVIIGVGIVGLCIAVVTGFAAAFDPQPMTGGTKVILSLGLALFAGAAITVLVAFL